jgi:hypothetical protein
MCLDEIETIFKPRTNLQNLRRFRKILKYFKRLSMFLQNLKRI